MQDLNFPVSSQSPGKPSHWKIFQKPAIRKSLRVAGFFIAGILLTLSLLLAILHFFYADRIKGFIINELNSYINTPVAAEEVRFSFIRDFPRASVSFTNILARPANPFRDQAPFDTLFFFRNLSLQFNILRILQKNYSLERISANQGTVNLEVDHQGNQNFRFWNESASSDTGRVHFKLNQVRIRDFRLTYREAGGGLRVSGQGCDLRLKGNFYSGAYDLKLALHMQTGRAGYGGYEVPLPFATGIEAGMNANGDRFTITRAELAVGPLRFDLSGSIWGGAEPGVDLGLSGQNLDIPTMMGLLPEPARTRAADYSGTGRIVFRSSIKGNWTGQDSPAVVADFGLEDGSLERKGVPVPMRDIRLKGLFSNGKAHSLASSSVRVSEFSCSVGPSGTCRGAFQLDHLDQPVLETHLTGVAKLEEILALFPVEGIQSANGSLRFSLDAAGPLKALGEKGLSGIAGLKRNLDITFTDLGLRAGSQFVLENCTGRLLMGNLEAALQLEGKANSNAIDVAATLPNLPAFLLGFEPVLEVSGKLSAPSLLLDKFAPPAAENSNASNSNPLPTIPKFLAIKNLEVQVTRFSSGRFQAKDLKARLSADSSLIHIPSLSLRTLNGNFSGNGQIKFQKDDGMRFAFDTHCARIDIHELFYVFRNFSQGLLRAEHITGLLSGQIRVQGHLNQKGEPVPEDLVMNASVVVENGELHQFEPLRRLSEYTRVGDLGLVKFSRLENTISIENKVILIPEMEIRSSAMNISLSGRHRLDLDYEYRLKLDLSEVLSAKTRKQNKGNEEFGEVIDDGLGRLILHLLVKGSADTYELHYDTQKAAQSVQEEFQVEKRTIKKLLNQDFGLFSKDTTLRQEPEKKKDPGKKKVRISFDPDDPGSN